TSVRPEGAATGSLDRPGRPIAGRGRRPGRPRRGVGNRRASVCGMRLGHLILCAVLGLGPGCVMSPPPDVDPDPDAGETPTDAGEVPVANGWSWLPVEGSRCARGATAGIGIKRGTSAEDLFIYLQGGGACWNRGTCAPSHLQFGPI